MANGAFINLTRPRRCVGSSRGALCEPETKIWAARLFPAAPAEDPERTSSKHLRFFSASEIPALVPQNYVVTDLAPKVWCSQTDPKENSGCCRGKSKRQGFTLEEVRPWERTLHFSGGCWMCWVYPKTSQVLSPEIAQLVVHVFSGKQLLGSFSWVVTHHELGILNFGLFFPRQTIRYAIHGIWRLEARILTHRHVTWSKHDKTCFYFPYVCINPRTNRALARMLWPWIGIPTASWPSQTSLHSLTRSGKQAWPKVHCVNFAQLNGWLKARRLSDRFAVQGLKRCLALRWAKLATRDGMMWVSRLFTLW